MGAKAQGKITEIIGAVLDIRFPEGQLPDINDAIVIRRKQTEGTDAETLTVEVAQHLGDDTVRCIALGPTDGLVRGMEALATGGPIQVPVGEETLGRIFNVLGDPIDQKPAPETKEKHPIHRKAPAFSEQSTDTEILETGITTQFHVLSIDDTGQNDGFPRSKEIVEELVGADFVGEGIVSQNGTGLGKARLQTVDDRLRQLDELPGAVLPFPQADLLP